MLTFSRTAVLATLLLASSLAGILVVVGGVVLAQFTVIGPLRQVNGDIAVLDEEIRKKDEWKRRWGWLDRILARTGGFLGFWLGLAVIAALFAGTGYGLYWVITNVIMKN